MLGCQHLIKGNPFVPLMFFESNFQLLTLSSIFFIKKKTKTHKSIDERQFYIKITVKQILLKVTFQV